MTNEEISGFSYRITQASKTELIVILYDMALNYIAEGIDCLDKLNLEGFRHNLKSAQRVVNQLMGALDMGYGISSELIRLYRYFINVLIRASVRKETDELKSIVKMISKLRDAFEKVSKQDKSGPVMKNTQQIYAGLTYSNGKLNEYQDQTVKRGFTV